MLPFDAEDEVLVFLFAAHNADGFSRTFQAAIFCFPSARTGVLIYPTGEVFAVEKGFPGGNLFNVIVAKRYIIAEGDKKGATYNGSTIKLYIDGVVQSDTKYVSSPIDSGVGNLIIGRLGSNVYPMNGQLDEVRIYNRALNAKEVAELYRAKSSYYGQGGTMSGNVTIAGNAVIEDVLYFETQASAPTSPIAGEMYSDGANLFFYDGSEW